MAATAVLRAVGGSRGAGTWFRGRGGWWWGSMGGVCLVGVEPSAYSRHDINIAPVERRGWAEQDGDTTSKPTATDRSTRQTDTTRLDSYNDCNHRLPPERGRGNRRAGTEETSGGTMGALDALGLPLCLGGLHRSLVGGMKGDKRTAQSGTRVWRVSRCSTPPGPGKWGRELAIGRPGRRLVERRNLPGVCGLGVGVAAAAGPCLFGGEGSIVMACCNNRRGREEEAVPFREGVN